MMMRLAKMAVFGLGALFAQLAAKAQEGLPPPRSDGERKRLAYATRENRPVDNHATEEVNAYPIDLATAIQLADANSPLIRIAQARMGAAQARKDLAELLFVPTLKFGPGYFRHDGVDQNRRGDVFQVSRSNSFALGGPSLNIDTAEAIYLPLVRLQQLNASRENARAVRNRTQLSAADSYFDLLSIHGRLAINSEILDRVGQMLERAKVADKAGLSKTKGDVDRALTELYLRRQERIRLEGQAGAAAARLAQVLLLPPETFLVPSEMGIYPLVLIPSDRSIEDLIETAVANRPELASSRFMAGAANESLRLAQKEPLIPRLNLDYVGGVFGGGRNSFIGDTSSREDLLLQMNWELRNFGFGNAAQIRERRAQLDISLSEVVQTQAVVTAEVTEAARLAAALFDTLEAAQKAVIQVEELYRKLLASSFGMFGPRETYDALEPLLAIQEINRARNNYLNEVIEFNKSQFELYMAIGEPPLEALDGAQRVELGIPAVPTGEKLPRPDSKNP